MKKHFSIPAYLYIGDQLDGTVCAGAPVGVTTTGELIFHTLAPNLGTVERYVRPESLRILRPLHDMPEPRSVQEYNRLVADAQAELRRRMEPEPADAEELRELARLANYLADLAEFVQIPESTEEETRDGI